MKFFLIVLFSIISQNFFCQEQKYTLAEEEIFQLFKNRDSTFLNENKEIILRNSTVTKLKKVVSREIDFNLNETIYDFTLNILLDEQYRNIDFKVHKYFLGGKYCGLILNNINSKVARKKFDFNNLFFNFLSARNKFYNTSYAKEDFVNQTLNYHIFGDECGYEMRKVKTIDGVKLYDLNSAENYVSWMQNMNLEKQMWGFNQLNYLKKKDQIEFENEEEKIFNHIKNRNAILESCSGCTFGIFEKAFK